jgi:hypothetical protein
MPVPFGIDFPPDLLFFGGLIFLSVLMLRGRGAT